MFASLHGLLEISKILIEKGNAVIDKEDKVDRYELWFFVYLLI